MSDFGEFDDDLFNNLNIEEEIRSELINETNLNDLGITTDRFSQDVKVNNYGHRLIEMCKKIDIHICNGRLVNDAFCGKHTCKDVSVVDNVVVSPILMPSITKFEICEFNNILSDVHCAVVFDININFNVELYLMKMIMLLMILMWKNQVNSLDGTKKCNIFQR